MFEDSSIELWMDELVDEVRTRSTGRATLDEASAKARKHFKLGNQPFSDSVNPDFFFRTEGHEEALIQMMTCIENDVSIGLTTAISGTGKTLLTQVLMSRLDTRTHQTVLLLAHPGMTRTSLLRDLLNELGYVDVPARTSVDEMVTAIQQHIIDQYMKGIKIVIIIDEVHFLQSYGLQVIRTLSNIEVPERKLVTLLLFGERSFLTRMNHPSYRSVFSRMFTRVELPPLDLEEVRQYVKFRLMVADGNPELFAPDCYQPLLKRSQGIPREVNRICHNALSMAARKGLGRVTGELIERIPAALDLSEG